MHRSAKEAFIAEMGEKVEKTRLAVVTDYRGLEVNDLTEFRKKLSEVSGVEFRVVKNTLTKRAIAGTPLEGLTQHLTGTNAVLLAYEDVVVAAKTLTEFAKDNEKLAVKGGVLDGKELSGDQLKALADLPSKEVLQAMLLGVLNAPARNLVSVLANVNRSLLNVLTAHKANLEAGGEG